MTTVGKSLFLEQERFDSSAGIQMRLVCREECGTGRWYDGELNIVLSFFLLLPPQFESDIIILA